MKKPLLLILVLLLVLTTALPAFAESLDVSPNVPTTKSTPAKGTTTPKAVTPTPKATTPKAAAPTPVTPPKDYVIVWKDKTVENGVRSALGKMSGPIYRSQLDFVKTLQLVDNRSLEINGKNYFTTEYNLPLVADLADMAHFINLTDLSILYQNALDFTNAPDLPKLTRLEVYICFDVKNLETIGKYSSLTALELYATTGAKDFSFLKKLTKLKTLDLGRTGFTQTKYLTGMQSLEKLSIYGNEGLTNASPLYKLSSLKELTYGGAIVNEVQRLKEQGVKISQVN